MHSCERERERERKKERKDVRTRQTSTIDFSSFFFLSFLFEIIYAIGLVNWMNIHFCPMINKNDVIWLEKKGKKKNNDIYH